VRRYGGATAATVILLQGSSVMFGRFIVGSLSQPCVDLFRAQFEGRQIATKDTPAPQRNVALPLSTARIRSSGMSVPFSWNCTVLPLPVV
jgi:hypothetical protein